MDFACIFYTSLLLSVRETFSVTLQLPHRNVTALTTHLSVKLLCSFSVDVESGPTTITWTNPSKKGFDSLIAQRSYPDFIWIGKQYERRVELDEYATLEIQSPMVSDSGLYKCKVVVGGDIPSSATGKVTLLVVKEYNDSSELEPDEAPRITVVPHTRLPTEMNPDMSFADTDDDLTEDGQGQNTLTTGLGILAGAVVLLAIIVVILHRKKIWEACNQRPKSNCDPENDGNDGEFSSRSPLASVEHQVSSSHETHPGNFPSGL